MEVDVGQRGFPRPKPVVVTTEPRVGRIVGGGATSWNRRRHCTSAISFQLPALNPTLPVRYRATKVGGELGLMQDGSRPSTEPVVIN